MHSPLLILLSSHLTLSLQAIGGAAIERLRSGACPLSLTRQGVRGEGIRSPRVRNVGVDPQLG